MLNPPVRAGRALGHRTSPTDNRSQKRATESGQGPHRTTATPDKGQRSALTQIQLGLWSPALLFERKRLLTDPGSLTSGSTGTIASSA